MEERLKEVSGRSLSGWATGPEATTPKYISACLALHLRYLEPARMTLGQYKARLARQARDPPDPPINGVFILLEPNKVENEDDNELIRWVK